MFRRHRDPAPEETTAAGTAEPVATGGSKGRPTPSRRSAEEARRERRKPTLTRKEQARRAREQRYEARMKQRTAMDTGDERYMPTRDRGPVRRYVRDYVDARRGVAEYLLPALVLILALSLVRSAWAQQAVFLIWSLLIIATVLDTIWIVVRLRAQLKEHFSDGDQGRRGAVAYGVLRSTQLRRFRLPKPQVARGESPTPRT